MNELLTFLTMWLTDLLVLGTALLAMGCLAVAILRQAAARMSLARGTLLGLAALSVLTALPGWPRQPLASFTLNHLAEEERDEAVQAQTSFTTAPVVVENPLPISGSSQSTTQKNPTFAFTKVVQLLPLVWLGAAGLGLIYMLVGACRAFRLLQTAEKAPDWSQQELERLVASAKSGKPRLKTSERIATAIALLAWRPHILLAAASVREENKAAVRAALAHEWAHIRHGDLWLLALERLLLPLFCLHPLFWLLRRQIRIDQELLADAAAAGDAPVEYAEALMSWAKAENNPAAPRWGLAALSLWEHPSNLSRRVEMLLHPQASAASKGSRLWKWLAPMSLLAAVLGLSLVTLRPAAVAQDDVVVEIEIQPRPDKVKKTKKEKPKKSEAKRTGDQLPLPVEAGEIILMDMLVGQVEHAALERAESSLGDLIQAASEDHCRLEGNLIVADLSAEQFSKLTGELKKANALTILSRPRVTTVDGQEASLQVGSAIPLVRLEKTVNGEPRRRVDFQDVGELIVIRPHQDEKDPSRLTLEIAATHTELDKQSELRTGDDTPRFIKHQLKLEVEATVGKILVVTEREPKKGSGRVHSILLAITPQKLAPPAPEPAPPAATRSNKVLEAPGNAGEKFKFTGDRDRFTMLVNTTRVVEFPLGVSKVLLKDPDILRVVPISPKSVTVSGLKPGTAKLSVWSGDDKPRSIDIIISNDLGGLRDENEELRQQIAQLQAKLVDLEAQVRWLRGAAAPGGKEKVSDETFLRRVYLDLTGVVPTVDQIRAFLSDQDKQKRDKLIDNLLEKKVFRDPDEAEEWKKAHPKAEYHDPAAIKPALPEVPAEKEESDSIQIFRLAYTPSEAAAEVIKKVLSEAEGLAVAVDERTNSLIVRGSSETQLKVKALLEALDQKVDSKKKPQESAPQKKTISERMNDANRQHSIKRLEREVQEAEAGLRSAEKALESAERLKDKGLVSEVQMEGAHFAVEKAKNNLNSVRMNLEKAQASPTKP